MKELKRLKYRFVLIVMALLFAVTSAVFAGIYYTMHRAETAQSMRMLEELAGRDGGAPRRIHPAGDLPLLDGQTDAGKNTSPTDGKRPYVGPFDGFADGSPTDFAMFRNSFSIRIDTRGSILSLNSAGGFFQREGSDSFMETLTESEREGLSAAVARILAGDARSGTVTMEETPYRYLRTEKPYGQIITLLDRSLEVATLNRLLSTLLLLGGMGLVLLFLVSLFLAERAIQPVRKAWERQKQFIADASHELKTPLTVIAANTDVILSNRNDTVASQAKWLGYIRTETERMSKLVSDLLNIAKIDASESKPLPLPFDLSEAVASVCLPLESLAFESGRTLMAALQPGIPYLGDKAGIQQAVGILVDNAIKHASGAGDIHVTLQREKESGKILISVRNPGEGIPKEEANRIFERFYRLDASRARNTGGYGLGLSIAKSVVERHGGTIAVDCSPDGQTTFTILLPHRKGH